MNFQGVWDCKERLSRVFYIFPETTLELRRKWRNEITDKLKIYAH